MEVTGEGTLKLPSGTFLNVLKMVRSEVDTEVYAGRITTRTVRVATEWLYPGIHEPLMTNTVEEETQTGSATTRYTYAQFTGRSPLGLNEVVKSNYNFTAYPNPATSAINVGLDLAQKSDVQINIISLNGQVVLQGNPEVAAAGKNKTFQIGIAALPAGFYVVDAIVSGVHIYQQFLKK